MHAIRLLETWLKRNCSFIHPRRRGTVSKLIDGLVRGEKSTLTHLGRSLNTDAYEKHNIKCVDRLMGNERLWTERKGVYRSIAHWLLSTVERPWIIVDWSDVELGHEYLMLKATVPVGGRALSIYEEVHPLKHYNSPKTHRGFLEGLREVVPESCRPIIISDAGFRGPWFEAVESYGWDWIGRVRNMVKYCPPQSTTWRLTRSLYYKATKRARSLGRHWFSKRHPYGCYLHLYKSLNRGLGGPRKPRRVSPQSQRARKLARDPWLLATSLSPKQWSARRVVKAYEKRMQIEETFRDLKSHRWGYGLQYARSRSTQRLENLLLVTTLATLATWLTGLAATMKGLGKHFQANTITERTVLSMFFLGRRILKSRRISLTSADLKHAARALPDIVQRCAQPA